jgi:hypothetical protein
MIDERTEQLITRRLDGQLAEGESLELDRELIRSPESRRAFEESQRIDALTAETLDALLDAGDSNHLQAADGVVSPAARRATRRRLDGAIGVAAAVLLVMASTSLLPQVNGRRGPGANTNAANLNQPAFPSGLDAPDQTMQYPVVIDNTAGPRRQHQRIDQDVIAVVDPETQTIYLLEIERARNSTSRLRVDY